MWSYNLQKSSVGVYKSFELFLKKSPRKVLYSETILHRGMSSLPLQDLGELHLKKKKNNTHKTCETPSKNKTKKFKVTLNMNHTPKLYFQLCQ